MNSSTKSAYSLLDDENLKCIQHEKLVFLNKMLYEAKTKSQSELLPFFLNLLQFSKSNSIEFSPDECNIIIKSLQENSTPAEMKRMEYILGVFKKMSNTPNKKDV